MEKRCELVGLGLGLGLGLDEAADPVDVGLGLGLGLGFYTRPPTQWMEKRCELVSRPKMAPEVGPGCSKAVKWATFEASGSSTRGSG